MREDNLNKVSPKKRRMGSKGLGMWIMSKTVVLIFLFSLVLIMSMFLRIYSEKVVSDTARSYTVYWSEIASGAMLFDSSSDSVFLEDLIRINDQNKPYTVFAFRAQEFIGGESQWRVSLLMSWSRFDDDGDYTDFTTEYDAGFLSKFEENYGYAAGSALNLPSEIDEVHFFNYNPHLSSPNDPYFDQVLGRDLDGFDMPLIAQPSSRQEPESNLIFYRNLTVFCVATSGFGQNISESIRRVGVCCIDDPRDAGVDYCD